jgi:excisionase family DNA binding protein
MPIKVGKKKLYSVEDLTKMLPITPLTIREYLRKGKIRGHKIGKNWYVTKENLEAFLEGKGQEGEEISKNHR